MNNFELNFNKGIVNSEKKNKQIQKNEHLKCEIKNLSKQHEEVVKKILDKCAIYLDHNVEVKFLDFIPHNPGMHSGLIPKFKTEDHYDSISINSNFADKNQIPYMLIHELGHAFEWQIKDIADKSGLQIFPKGGDQESNYFDGASYREFQADFFVGYIMNKEYVKENCKNQLQKNTFEVFERLFVNNDFGEIKELINKNEAAYKNEMIEKYKSGEIEKPEWLDENYLKIPLYRRAFDKKADKEYKNYFTQLEKKYQND